MTATAVDGQSSAGGPEDEQLISASHKFESGDLAGSLAVIEHVLQRNPQNANAWADKGVVKYFMQEFDEAQAAWERAQQYDTSKNPKISFNLGRIYDVKGRKEEAVQLYRQAIESSPSDGAIWANLSGTLCSLNRLDEAIEAGEKAINLDPSDSIARLNLSVIYNRAGKLNERNSLEQEIIMDHRTGNKNLRKALEALVQNRHDREHWHGVVEVWKRLADFDVAQLQVSTIAIVTESLNRIMKHDDAMSLLRRALVSFVGDFTVRTLIGQQYLDYTMEPGEAVDHFNWVLENDVEGGELGEHARNALVKLSACYGKLEDYDKTLEVCERARKIIPDESDIYFNSALAKVLTGTPGSRDDFLRALELQLIPHYLAMWMSLQQPDHGIHKAWVEEIAAHLLNNDNYTWFQVYTCVAEAYEQNQMTAEAAEYHNKAIKGPNVCCVIS
eukprot:GFYU01010233.1.p1 GENE.GFYU01010233.1~~GFYU01010233.1.p1  ORF type:complete len:444 (-),score=146.22 GFYU01010233.1:1707-3038(-)